MSTLSIIIKTAKNPSDYKKSSQPVANLKRIEDLIRGLACGSLQGSVDIHGDSSDPVAASATITVASVSAADTVTIGKTVLTGAASPSGESQWDSDGSDSVVAAAIVAKINAHSVLSKLVTASASSAVITVTANVKGEIGNHIALASSNGTRLAVTGSGYLASGTGGPASAAVTIGR